MGNLMKVQVPETGPLQGDRAWFGGPKSAQIEILQTREPQATSQPAQPIQPGRPNRLCWLAGGSGFPILQDFKLSRFGTSKPCSITLRRSHLWDSHFHQIPHGRTVSIRLCVRRLAPIPAGESQDVTNKIRSYCLLCVSFRIEPQKKMYLDTVRP